MTPHNQGDTGLAVHSTYYPQAVRTKSRNQPIYLLAKRSMDFSASLLGIIMLSPIFLLLAIIIKWEDPKGSVLFSQTRIGKGGQPFRMYKFRSMVANAEDLLQDLLAQNEIQGAMFKMKQDPRITRVGRFIRRTSIDELPQLFNVLKGDMSLVGPRPPLPHEVAEYTDYDMQRLTVVPGCSGLWQVSGRNNLDFNQMVELDLQYIARRSFWFDLRILIKTVLVLFGSKDAF